MKTFFERLLEYYSLTIDEYNKLQIEDENYLPKFTVFPKMLDVVEYFKRAIKENKKILIYGDYDCDGIMSTSIMMNLFLKEHFVPGFYIPSREDDGYGLTKENAKRFKDLGYDIILTVDNGISLNEVIDYANSIGLEVVIFDHHTIQDKLPNARYILHPSLSSIGEFNISAGEVCFYFSWAYLGYIDKYLLTLAAISTISDMMVLKDYNRLMVKLGLKYLNEERFTSIYNLIDKKYETISEDNFALEIAPKVNSICRVLNDNTRFNIVKYFLSDDGKNSQRLKWINEINKSRKDLIVNLCKDIKVEDNDDSIVVISDSIEGLSGLIANNLLTKYEKPVVVFSYAKEEGYLKGSARSKNGFNIVKAFQSLDNLLEVYGGHACAGGLTIKKENFYEFQKQFNKLAKEYPFKDEQKKLLEIKLPELTIKDYNLYRTFGPFGEGFEKPKFLVKDFSTIGFTPSQDEKHIFATLSPNAKFAYFNFDSSILNYSSVDLIGELTRNTFNGYTYVQFLIRDFNKRN